MLSDVLDDRANLRMLLIQQPNVLHHRRWVRPASISRRRPIVQLDNDGAYRIDPVAHNLGFREVVHRVLAKSALYRLAQFYK